MAWPGDSDSFHVTVSRYMSLMASSAVSAERILAPDVSRREVWGWAMYDFANLWESDLRFANG